MGHSHEHGHSHDHTHGANKKTLMIAFIIITSYMIVEVVGGLYTNSLALLSDAGHMLSDAIALGVGVLAFTISEKVANNRNTYGYKRFEILAAVFNGVTLILIAIFICVEAIQRFTKPQEIASSGMLIIAIIGLLVNILVAWILMRGGDTHDNLNMRAAFLHVISDMLGSVGAIIAAILIMLFGWEWADPVASIIVAILVLTSGWRVTKASIHVLMEGTPSNVETDDIISTFQTTEGILAIHDLHIWSITSGQNALSCHVVVDGKLTVKDSQIILQELEHKLLHLGIGHMTVQLENDRHKHDNTILCKLEERHSHHHEH
ncbi:MULTISPECIES: cation diffusion facilitator family transporter [unclassified Rummeliibacillus]|uniref:cation diffusion facilitator family transporter n=1 Tax=unclassified Rummeliibacillus TaxID=2622809 RepID=UPI000E671E70|nr:MULTISPECIES: cation diffusion facilitator family transporter [unclassified Rummeliibacillus]RIJ67580.1 cation transporter [Rummeliibacillus sp. POC4]RPJ95334.1 cation transporter [Rummeliibacillus sp. TYF005]